MTAVYPYTGVRVTPLVRWALFVTVFLIPLEYPDRIAERVAVELRETGCR
jgi:hypothetical protein